MYVCMIVYISFVLPPELSVVECLPNCLNKLSIMLKSFHLGSCRITEDCLFVPKRRHLAETRTPSIAWP